MAKRVGRGRVRELLGLAVWEVELAVQTGLLRRLPDRSFDPVSINTAQADLELFRRLLAAERRCNTSEAAARLGISTEAFKRVAVEEAARAASRLSDASVAEIFGLSVEVIRLLRPNSGRWSAEFVAQLFRRNPRWLRDETAARAEADRRRRATATRARRRAALRLSWRHQ